MSVPARILRAWRVELRPTVEQRRYLVSASGVARAAFNWALSSWRAESSLRGIASGLCSLPLAVQDGLRTLDGFPQRGWAAARSIQIGLCGLDGLQYDPEPVATPWYHPNGDAIHARLTAVKHRQFPWMAKVSSMAVREAVHDVDCGWQHFFRKLREKDPILLRARKKKPRAGEPRFRSRKDGLSWHVDQGNVCHVRSNAVWCPGLTRFGSKGQERGWISVARGQVGYLPTNAGTTLCAVAFHERAGRWFAVVRAEVPAPAAKPRVAGLRMGVEVGVRVLAQTSTGRSFGAVRSFDAIQKAESKIRLWDRRMDRRFKKGVKTRDQSAGWHEAVRMLQRYYCDLSNARADALHQCSRRIVNMGAETIVLRENDVAGMLSRDAQQDDEARRRRNRIAPLVAQMGGMYELRRQIEYKQTWAGGQVQRVPADEPTTLRCSMCHAVRDTDPGYPDFSCPSCGHVEDREANSARNLRDYAAAPGNGNSGLAGGRAVRQKRGRKPKRTAGGTGSLGAGAQAPVTSPEGGATSALGPGNQASGEASADADDPDGTGAGPTRFSAAAQLDGGMVPPPDSFHDIAPSERFGDADHSTTGSQALAGVRTAPERDRSHTGPQGRGSPRDLREPPGAIS